MQFYQNIVILKLDDKGTNSSFDQAKLISEFKNLNDISTLNNILICEMVINVFNLCNKPKIKNNQDYQKQETPQTTNNNTYKIAAIGGTLGASLGFHILFSHNESYAQLPKTYQAMVVASTMICIATTTYIFMPSNQIDNPSEKDTLLPKLMK